MLISFVITSYNNADSIKSALDSVFNASLPSNWLAEAIVIDDGSADGEKLADIVARYKDAILITHSENLGICAGRNTGIAYSHGEIVVILDADDEMVSDWPNELSSILDEWPKISFVCFAACENLIGKVTAQNPNYEGPLTLYDLINERYAGEYLPIFRGAYIRNKKFIDLSTRKSCGIISYINFAHDAPFWISKRIMRIYNDSSVGSVTSNWTGVEKSRETVQCYLELFERYSHLYRSAAPKTWKSKQLRLAVYLRYANMPGAWAWWWKGISFACLLESVGAFMILLLGRSIGGWVAKAAKRIGLIRRYG